MCTVCYLTRPLHATPILIKFTYYFFVSSQNNNKEIMWISFTAATNTAQNLNCAKWMAYSHHTHSPYECVGPSFNRRIPRHTLRVPISNVIRLCCGRHCISTASAFLHVECRRWWCIFHILTHAARLPFLDMRARISKWSELHCVIYHMNKRLTFNFFGGFVWCSFVAVVVVHPMLFGRSMII